MERIPTEIHLCLSTVENCRLQHTLNGVLCQSLQEGNAKTLTIQVMFYSFFTVIEVH